MVQRTMRLFEMRNGARQHSYYIGTSPLKFSWLPHFLLNNRRVARFIDPLVCSAIGFAFIPLSRALAGWIIFSALCLRCYEFIVQESEIDAQLDTADSLMDASRQEETMQKIETTQTSQTQSQDGGVPTGMGADIRNKIKSSTER